MKLCVIPIDNRPVCYNLVKDIIKIDDSIELFIPPRNMLGGLKKNADIIGLYSWLCKLPKVDAMVVSLDTIAYGGLIPSRRSPESFNVIESRMNDFKEVLKSKNAKIYAVSSIMRISNNNYNEEEKEYWNKYGEYIFQYSYEKHKYAIDLGLEIPVRRLIPDYILNDYKQTRARNFSINKMYLKWQKEGLFDTLVFCKDDCAQYGYNVMEAEMLSKMGGEVITGADEIPLALISKAINSDLSVKTLYTENDSTDLISNYEDVSVKKSIENQLKFAGITKSEEDEYADITLIINNFKSHQGEIVMKKETQEFSGELNIPDSPYMIADIRNANGADNHFVNEFLKIFKYNNFYGYSAWNTTSNTVGSLLCCAKIKFNALKNGTYNESAFKKVQMIRLLDDWAYQANIRQILTKPSNIQDMMKPYEDKVSEILNLQIKNEYNYPWNRLFEIEVEDELR